MNRRTHIPQRGLTLVEVLVALALLAVGLAGVLETNYELANALAKNRRAIQANYLVQDRLATLEAAGFEALEKKIDALAPAEGAAAVSLFPGFRTLQNNSIFQWNADLAREMADGNRRIKLAVSVKWLDRGKELTRKATGYVFAP